MKVRQQFTLKESSAKAHYKMCTVNRSTSSLNTLTTKFTFTLVLCSFHHSYVHTSSSFLKENLPLEHLRSSFYFFPSNKVFQAIFLYLFPHLLHVNFLFCSFPINAVALPKLYFLHSSQIDLYHLPPP